MAISNYHALQVQLRRRYTNGLTLNANYTLAKNETNIWADNATQSGNYRTLRDRRSTPASRPSTCATSSRRSAPTSCHSARIVTSTSTTPILNAVVGGWTLGTVITAQSGTPFRLSSGRQTVNGKDAGVVLKNGHTIEEIQDMITIRPGPGFNRYWIDPTLVGPDGRANPEYLDVPTAPGEWGQFIYLRGRTSGTSTARWPRRSRSTAARR